jgi:hypothetical protein
MSGARLPLSPTAEGVLVTVRVTPRARRAGVEGQTEISGPRGPEPALSVRVTAPPAEGAANEAVRRTLAAAWRLPPSALEIAGGGTSRIKRVLVRGEPSALLRLISDKLAQSSDIDT